ncbi:MAG: peptidoglycan-associated lipoprotein Pal [Pseudomonadota bacterium]
MKHVAYALALTALLAGCADQPTKDAVIEDRGIKALPATEDAKAAANAVDGKPAADATQATGTQAQQKVETTALPATAADVKPLVAGTPEAAAAANDPAAIALRLKDPASPLSKRVIMFDYDSAAIRDEYRTLLEAHAEFLKANTASKVILQGHADERGSREYNLALGQRRAESVYKAMQLLGVGDTQMEAASLGEEKPVAPGHDEESWQQNRRAEILYQGE